MKFLGRKQDKAMEGMSGSKGRGNRILSSVPKPGHKTLHDGCILLANGELTDFVAVERFRMLRAQVERLSLADRNLDIIALTSAVPSEGKSVTSVNLSRAFASDPNGKTIIVDCDLRKPNVHRFFGEASSPGLTDLLVAGAAFESVIRKVGPGIDAIFAGSPVVDSSRVIESEGFSLLLSELRKRYSNIILDCPPVLLCSEVMAISQLASGTLLVTRAWRTEQALVQEAAEMLRPHDLLGVVLNECTDSLRQYGYYGYYGYVGGGKGSTSNKSKGFFGRLFRK
jgi:capsular exopolysaccharide synthesis family protein